MDMQAQIYKLLAMRVLRAFMIAMPVIVIYWQSHGLAIRDIFILQVIFSIALIVFEVPSGYLADLFGKKNSLIAGSTFTAVGFFCYWLLPSYGGFIVAELVIALGISFISGANSAILYETLSEHQKEQIFKKYEGRLMAAGMLSEATAALAASVVVMLSDVETVLLIQAVMMAAVVPISLTLYEPKRVTDVQTPSILITVRSVFGERRQLRYLHLLSAAISSATLTAVWFIQPHWKSIGVDVIYFGYLWAALSVIVALGSMASDWLEERLRFRTLFGLMAVAPLVIYGLLAFFHTSLVALLIAPLFWLLRGIQTPIIQDYVNRECRNEERATVLSINALGSRLLFSLLSPFLGWAADIWSFAVAFSASAVTFGIIGLLGFLLLSSVSSRTVTKNA